jgi:hypothetical protein
MTHFDFKCLLPALLQVEDRMSMAHGLEARVPLLDHRVVEFAATIPADVKFRDGRMKHFLKTSFAPELPRQLLELGGRASRQDACEKECDGLHGFGGDGDPSPAAVAPRCTWLGTPRTQASGAFLGQIWLATWVSLVRCSFGHRLVGKPG